MKILKVVCICAAALATGSAAGQEPEGEKKQVIRPDTVWAGGEQSIVYNVVEANPTPDAEVMPTFRGGDLNTFRTWVESQIKYPANAASYGVDARVVATFVIDADGRLGSISVTNPGTHFGREVARVLRMSPRWQPGLIDGAPAKVKFYMPVGFEVDSAAGEDAE